MGKTAWGASCRVTTSYAPVREHGGPNPHNIALMLKAQCVLYTRCASELAPFKYSGYPLLLQRLQEARRPG